MVAGGGMTCVKYLLFFFNLIFVLSGIVVITVGALIQSAYNHYADFVEPSFITVPILLIVVGCIVFIVAFFGCCGAVKENHCMILTFSILLLIIFILELVGGILSYVKNSELESILSENFRKTLDDYPDNTQIQQSWNIIQHELQCCGSNGASDWTSVGNGTIPASCCNDLPVGQTCAVANAYSQGCMNVLLNLLRENALILGGVGIGIAAVQLLGVIFACCLARSIRREYETV